VAVQGRSLAADSKGVTRRADAQFARLQQQNATWSVFVYSGLIAVLLPAFHYVLTALPGVPPGSDSMPLRCAAATFSTVLAVALWLFKPLRRHAVAVQFFNVLVTIVVIAVLVVNSGNHYAYIASGFLAIIGAQQAFYRITHLAFAFVVGFAVEVACSAVHGILWTPMGLAALGTFGSGYIVGFIPAALRIRIQRSEIRNRLDAQNAKDELQQVQAITHLGSWTRDLDTGDVEWSAELYDIFGVPRTTPPSGLKGMYERCIFPADRAAVERRLAEAAASGDGSYVFDHRILSRDGTVRWIELHGKYEYDDAGSPARRVGAVLDVTARKEAEEALFRAARFDPLTGLPNRITVQQLLADEIARVRRDGSQCAVAFLDLDRFKDINDTLGHDVGDQVLRDVSSRFAMVLPVDGVLARWGGDEFVMIMPSVRDRAAVEALAHDLVSAVAEPFHADDLELTITVSVGVALCPAHGTDAGVLIRNADTAMYKAKQELGCGYTLFSEELHAAASARHQIQNELRKALADGGLHLYYQPIVDPSDGRVVAAEALVRWIDGNGTVHLPGEFITIAEDSRIIIPLGTFVLNAACERAARWQRRGLDLTMAVNVSPRQFEHPDFIATLAGALSTSGADPSRLEIEITEAAIMSNAEPVIATLKAIHAMGIRVAIDDFGTGYSSFAYLKRFEVDCLKIDRTFVDDIEREDNLAIARSIVSVAHALNLRVTAEGVETATQARLLASIGCDRLQGYHFGRPSPVTQFEAMWFEVARAAVS
jgi:diguanylate cyclase (GGDEF)-like protein/PAS domain S-box-containing protein